MQLQSHVALISARSCCTECRVMGCPLSALNRMKRLPGMRTENSSGLGQDQIRSADPNISDPSSPPRFRPVATTRPPALDTATIIGQNVCRYLPTLVTWQYGRKDEKRSSPQDATVETHQFSILKLLQLWLLSSAKTLNLSLGMSTTTTSIRRARMYSSNLLARRLGRRLLLPMTLCTISNTTTHCLQPMYLASKFLPTAMHEKKQKALLRRSLRL